MAKTEEFQIRPKGWENDADEERIRFSSLDYLAASTYNSYALFFRLDDAARANAVEVLKKGLAVTLAQCRQLVGTIEKNAGDDDHSFVKRRDSAVKLVVKTFAPGDGVPSLDELEKAHFASSALGDSSRLLVVDGMTYGEKPECLPSAKPVVAAFQANLVPGGLVFLMNHHHYANDVMGWANSVHQLADNCRALVAGTPLPPWDPANLDASRFTATGFPSAGKVDGPIPPARHPDLREHASLLFHLPQSKAAALKQLATPSDPDRWISTYDAFTAMIWRTLTRHRAALYKSDPAGSPLFLEARNLFWAAASAYAPDPLLTTHAVASASPDDGGVPLARLASYIRSLTDGCDQAALDAALATLAPVRDKTVLFTRVNSFPPLTMATTDWRDTDVCGADFGFGKPVAFRHLFDAVTEGLVLIYPPRAAAGTDEGCEFVLMVEKEVVDGLMADIEFGRYFEFRGYEVRRYEVKG
ncbi:hypothetical protein B0T26DRAFT_845136 [Lasiosphaeria miniovina]|uniref:Trichothecene 3-O-acetyltransferase-like N-terminal domain-containing protein n=1 Tax=Lasiosphaeria miniovina TaxID=1954250 RepID=A0AA40EDU3_9PEZI|nr:uncharacterized protein B0T26DRAFT_845136 [Lasiosphaeria miniovina]KAK0734707.1 hypothetical protein B0T26DRAFT_845136 [Lasiosphaeria miniovina]